MVQDWTESTRETINYRRFINQFPPDIIKSMRLLERIFFKNLDKNVYNVQSNIYMCIYTEIRKSIGGSHRGVEANVHCNIVVKHFYDTRKCLNTGT